MLVLSEALAQEFAKATNDKVAKENKGTYLYGTVRVSGETIEVLFDGADIYTPCSTTVEVQTDDRVMVLVKDRSAVITSNLTTPSIHYKIGPLDINKDSIAWTDVVNGLDYTAGIFAVQNNDLTSPFLRVQIGDEIITSLNYNGKLYSKNAEITGKIYATAGEFSGELKAATGTFAGSLSAATGSFSGSLSAATGSFAGTLSAAKGTFAGTLEAVDGTFKGNLEAAGGTFKGNLSAAGGTFAGELSAATGTFAGSLSAAKGTFAGALSAATGTFKGELVAATGKFAGELSAATGTFKGSLSAAKGTFAGDLSAAGGTFKGNLSAAKGTFAGQLSAATGTFAGSLSAATGTFKGKLEAATGTFKGQLSAATGSFSGTLSAATGTFKGSLSGASITGATGTFSGTVKSQNVVAQKKFYMENTSVSTALLEALSYTYDPNNTASSCLYVGKSFRSVTLGSSSVSNVYLQTRNGSSDMGGWIGMEWSDIRLKSNITDSELNALSVLNQIRVRQFDWKTDHTHQDIGFIADEIDQIDSRFSIGGGYDLNGDINIKMVNIPYITAYLVKAVQQLSAKIDILEGRSTNG